MSSDWPILTKLRCKLLRRCYTQATLRKVEVRSTFLAIRNATIAVATWGVKREFFLATCNATFVALQVARKIASCNMAFSHISRRRRGRRLAKKMCFYFILVFQVAFIWKYTVCLSVLKLVWLNFRIPGHSICIFKCCYRSPTVVIISIITVYKNHEHTSFFHPLRDCGPR